MYTLRLFYSWGMESPTDRTADSAVTVNFSSMDSTGRGSRWADISRLGLGTTPSTWDTWTTFRAPKHVNWALGNFFCNSHDQAWVPRQPNSLLGRDHTSVSLLTRTCGCLLYRYRGTGYRYVVQCATTWATTTSNIYFLHKQPENYGAPISLSSL